MANSSETGSLLDTFLLYLYQTIVLVALAAVGFIVYMLRTRGPLKESRGEKQLKKHRDIVVDENRATAAAITNGAATISNGTTFNSDHNSTNAGQQESVAAVPPPPPPPATSQQQLPLARRSGGEEEEEEEEEEGPVITRQPPIRRMIMIAPEESAVAGGANVPPQPPQAPYSYQQDRRMFDDHGNLASFPMAEAPLSVSPTPAGFSDALKFDARKRVSQAVQKQQLIELIQGGEFDEAITNIRAASHRLQSDGF